MQLTMDMNTRLVKAGLITISLILSFQNCSQVAFEAVPPDPLANKEALRSLEPALAVRATGCIQCHANLSSNLVTDFGFGNTFYFGQNKVNKDNVIDGQFSGSPYGDHANNYHTMKIAGDKKVFVPYAPLPSAIAEATTLSTLSDYIRSQFSAAEDVGTRTVEVKEISRIYIAAPTEQELKASFSLGNARMKFIKSGATDLQGLSDRGTYFTTNRVLRCDGDLIVKGPLYLNNLQLETQRGCRIHVIGSVFGYGEITYLGESASRNLQITATKSINLGLGTVVREDGAFCDPNGKHSKGGHNLNSIVDRYVSMWTVPFQNLRGVDDPRAFGESIVAEANLIEAGTGQKLQDADCESSGRTVAFERLLLNAPVVMSRYNGNVKGTIIAEFALMSLGAFKFEFDPIFTQVDVLPRLEQASFLTIQH